VLEVDAGWANMLMMTAGEMMVGRPEEREADQMKQNKKKAQPEGRCAGGAHVALGPGWVAP
jgi:hypothetical protein